MKLAELTKMLVGGADLKTDDIGLILALLNAFFGVTANVGEHRVRPSIPRCFAAGDRQPVETLIERLQVFLDDRPERSTPNRFLQQCRCPANLAERLLADL